MTNGQPVTLLIDQDLDESLVCSPFFWRPKGSWRRSPWNFGYVTGEFDPDQSGVASILCAFDSEGSALAGFPIRGCGLLRGHQAAVGDIDGDGSDDLIVLDADGQVHVFGIDGQPIETFKPAPPDPSEPVRLTRLLGPPLVADGAADGKPRILLVSAENSSIGFMSHLGLLDVEGRFVPGPPRRLMPPAVTAPQVGRFAAGEAPRVAFVRGDGSIFACDPVTGEGAALAATGARDPMKVAFALADVDGDGADEVLYATGYEEVSAAGGEGSALGEPWPVRVPGGRVTALAAARSERGPDVVCAFDDEGKQFVLFGRDGRRIGELGVQDAEGKVLAHLSATAQFERVGACFAAVLFRPNRPADVDEVFGRHANAESRADCLRYRQAAQAELPPAPTSQELGGLDEDVTGYKESLLIDQLGAEDAGRLLAGEPMRTEVWLFDTAGTLRGGFPLALSDAHPYLDLKQNFAAAPCVLHDKREQRLLVLVGVNRREAGASVRVWAADL